jgi:DNA-binding transcriptional ArsR family regulator
MRRLSNDQAARIASRARAIGDPTRVRILNFLARGEFPVGHVANALATQQSTVSKHLQVLFNAGLVRRRRQASTVIYSLFTPELLDLCSFLGRRSLLKPAEVSAARMEAPRTAKEIATSRGSAVR